MSGCDYNRPSFKVQMSGKQEDNPCFDCINNKYRGGDIELCDACVKHNNYKAKEEANAKKGL